MEARLYHVIVKQLFFFPKLDSSFTEKPVKTNQLFSFYIFPSLHFFLCTPPSLSWFFNRTRKPKNLQPTLQNLFCRLKQFHFFEKIQFAILTSPTRPIHEKNNFTNCILKGMLHKIAALSLVTRWSLYFRNNLSILMMFVLNVRAKPLHYVNRVILSYFQQIIKLWSSERHTR